MTRSREKRRADLAAASPRDLRSVSLPISRDIASERALDVTVRHEQAILLVGDHFARTEPAVEGYDRQARRHRLQQHDPPPLVAGREDKGVGGLDPEARSFAHPGKLQRDRPNQACVAATPARPVPAPRPRSPGSSPVEPPLCARTPREAGRSPFEERGARPPRGPAAHASIADWRAGSPRWE